MGSSVSLYSIASLLFVFHSSLLSAQKISDGKRQGPDVISVIGGAQIYSTDESFNAYIVNNSTKVDGSITIVGEKHGSRKLIVKSEGGIKDGRRNFASHIKENQRKKDASDLKKVKAQLKKYEEQKAHLLVKVVEAPGSSDRYFRSKYSSRSTAVPNFNKNDVSKSCIVQDSYILKRALHDLHYQKYLFYNNRSLALSFTLVFSVRPPPVLA
ncbi:hypothetical protein IO89_15070 [Epilithonimonas lactis]|uniref:Uncharacterized protein n=1 Tax=Epilithonimonas lactis TaxID=421072 RepID=A0A085BGA0_9FLAO|nr:hypothetical protein IO89_15070 [Epilithonimonas lactis]